MEEEYKIKYLVLEIIKRDEDWAFDLLNHSDFIYEDHCNQHVFPNAYNLKVFVKPNKFIAYSHFIDKASLILKSTINQVSTRIIDNIDIKPDYKKLIVHNSIVKVIKTNWQEIDESQEILIKMIDESSHSLEFQNIGNTARTIMDKLARAVFNSEIHRPKDPNIEVQNGKFKNQFQVYFSFELKGSQNKNLRTFANTAIEYTEKSIDLMNKTTHLIGAEQYYAEVCVMSTLGIISLVKAIESKKTPADTN